MLAVGGQAPQGQIEKHGSGLMNDDQTDHATHASENR